MRLVISTLTAVMVLSLGSAAFALGPKFGVRLGAGTGFGEGDGVKDADITNFSVGGALAFELAVLGLEVDLLYTAVTFKNGGVEAKSTDIDLPMIATFGLPVVPAVFTLKVGAGVQPRFHLASEVEGETVSDADDKTESPVIYVPIVIGGTLNLGVASLGLDIRYLRQISETVKDSDDKVHHVVFMAGLFF